MADPTVHSLTVPDSAETLGDRAALSGTRLEALRATDQASTEFGLTGNGVYASAGPGMDCMTWKSWTITEGMQV